MKWLTEDIQCMDITFKKDAGGPPNGMCVNTTGVGASAFSFGSPEPSACSNAKNSTGGTSTKSAASKTTFGMLSALSLFAVGLVLF